MIVFYLLIIIESFFIIRVIKSLNKQVFNKKDILFEPIGLFSMSWLILYTFVPFIMVYTKTYYYEESYSITSIIVSKFQTLVFYIIVLFFYKVYSYNSNFLKKKEVFKPLFIKERFLINVLFLMTIIITINYLKYILSFDFATYLRNRIILNQGMGFETLFIFSSNILVLILFISTYLFKKRKFVNSIVLILTLLIFIITYLLVGSRLTVFLLLILILFVFIYLKKSIKRRFMLKITILGFLFLSIMSYIGFARLRLNQDSNFTDFKAIFKEELLNNIVINFGKFENLLWLNENFSSWRILSGKTFFAGFTNIIPRSLWPDKPLGGGPELKNLISPGSYDLSNENLTSYTTGLITESYMNFGILGFVIIPAFFAFTLVYLKKIENKIKGNIILLSIYIYLIFSICFVLQYGEFLGVFARTLFVIFPYFIIYKISKPRNKKIINEK